MHLFASATQMKSSRHRITRNVVSAGADCAAPRSAQPSRSATSRRRINERKSNAKRSRQASLQCELMSSPLPFLRSRLASHYPKTTINPNYNPANAESPQRVF